LKIILFCRFFEAYKDAIYLTKIFDELFRGKSVKVKNTEAKIEKNQLLFEVFLKKNMI